jgi:hypothetical protein
MVRLNLIGPERPEETDNGRTERDWKKAIPPWMTMALLMLTLPIIGGLAARLLQAEDDKYVRLEAATRNARDVYTAGLSERLASVEAEQRSLKEAVADTKLAVSATNKALEKVGPQIQALALTNERLSTRVESLTSELEARRVR